MTGNMFAITHITCSVVRVGSILREPWREVAGKTRHGLDEAGMGRFSNTSAIMIASFAFAHSKSNLRVHFTTFDQVI